MKEKIQFDGTFDDVVRERLKLRISELHVAQRHIADYLGISKCTLQKWLNGRTTLCSGEMFPRITAFLNGELDSEIASSAMNGSAVKYLGLVGRKRTASLDVLLDRLVNAYDICERHGCGNVFLRKMSNKCERCAGMLG